MVSDVSQKADTAKNAQAFLLLAGVFGAVIAAMVLKRKFQKDKRKKTADKSQLTAKERDEIRLAEKKRKKEKKKVVKKKRSVPRTTQKTLPYKCVCDNFLMKVDDNKYSKTYVFEDVNYSIAKQEEQESIFLGYCSVLNSFDTSADIQITVHNNRVNKDEFNRMVLLRYKGNDYDHYIDVYNEMLKDKMEKGQNGIIRKKYLTVTLQAPDLETARGKFTAIDLELTNAFKKIGSVITPLTSNDRVNLLKDIFKSVDDKIPELSEKDFKRQAERAYCCPDYFEFKKDYFMWNNKYARTMFIKDMPSSLKDDMLTEIANTNLDVMITVNIAPVDPYKALKIVNHQLTSMRANKLQAEKNINNIVDGFICDKRSYSPYSEITSLNQFGNKKITTEDYNEILAILAVKKYRQMDGDSDNMDAMELNFTDEEIAETVERFYTFEYSYSYGHCAGNDCKKKTRKVVHNRGTKNQWTETITTYYCDKDHQWLHGKVTNKTLDEVLASYDFSDREQELYEMYLGQINVMMGG